MLAVASDHAQKEQVELETPGPAATTLQQPKHVQQDQLNTKLPAPQLCVGWMVLFCQTLLATTLM
jgi:hypothetical protein